MLHRRIPRTYRRFDLTGIPRRESRSFLIFLLTGDVDLLQEQCKLDSAECDNNAHVDIHSELPMWVLAIMAELWYYSS